MHAYGHVRVQLLCTTAGASTARTPGGQKQQSSSSNPRTCSVGTVVRCSLSVSVRQHILCLQVVLFDTPTAWRWNGLFLPVVEQYAYIYKWFASTYNVSDPSERDIGLHRQRAVDLKR